MDTTTRLPLGAVVRDHAPAFDEFWADVRPRVARALVAALGDVALAAEATDEAMARAYARWATVSQLESPAGWVYRVGLNWSRSVLRRVRRTPPTWLTTPSHHDDRDTLDPAVLVALAALPAGQRDVVVSRLLLGLSEAQTAAALRIATGTVKSRLARAVQTLHVTLAHLDPKETEE